MGATARWPPLRGGDVVDVDEQLADYLCEKDEFGRVGDDAPEAAGDEPDEDEEEEAAEDAAEPEGFDVEAWLDQHYQAREEQVRDGDVDEHLDAIAEAETATTVQDAIGERRAEIEA